MAGGGIAVLRMDEVHNGSGQQLFRREAKTSFPRGIDAFEVAVESGDTQQVQGQVEESIPIGFGTAALDTLANNFDRATDGCTQPIQVLLGDVVSRPVAEGLGGPCFIHGAGQENEWHFGTLFPGQPKGGKPVEERQGVVGKDQIETLPLQRGHKFLAVPGRDETAPHTLGLKSIANQFQILLVVLQVQDGTRPGGFPGGLRRAGQDGWARCLGSTRRETHGWRFGVNDKRVILSVELSWHLAVGPSQFPGWRQAAGVDGATRSLARTRRICQKYGPPRSDDPSAGKDRGRSS